MIKKKEDPELIWQKVPVDYYEKGVKKNIGQRLWHNQKFLAITKIVEGLKAEKILDVGSNGGILTSKISNLYPKAKVTGIDVYDKAVKYAGEKHPQIKFLVADAQSLPFKNNEFDLIFCLETLEHIVLPQKVLGEMKRCLTASGRIIVSMDTGNILFTILWFFWTTFGNGKVWQGSHLYHFTRTTLKKMIAKQDLIIEKEIISHLGMATTLRLKKA